MSTAPNQRARGLELGRTAVTTGHESLFAALQRLDRLLEAARDSAEQTYGSTEKDPYRGFYVSPQDFRSMLERPPGAPLLFSESTDRQEEHGPLGRLQRRFDLSSFDLDALLIVLAPEIDLRYQRLYAYLQDDVTRKRPSIDLVLNLLCPTAAAKIDARPRFGAEAPLIGNLLLRIASNDNHGETPLLARELRMEDAVVAAIVGECELDQCICPFSKLVHPGDAEVRSADNALTKALIRLAAKAREEGSGRVFYFQGHRGAGSETAAAIALALDCQLLSADLHTAVAAGTDLSLAAKLLPRDARLHDAVLYLEGVDALRTSELQGRLDLLLLSIRDAMGLTIVAGEAPWAVLAQGPWAAANVISTTFSPPDFEERQACWQQNLKGRANGISETDLEAVAGRFRLTKRQIRAAVDSACGQAKLRAAQQDVAPVTPTVQDLYAAGRAQSTHNLSSLARKIEPKYDWQDLVLPEDPLAQLHELCNQVRFRHLVYGNWGFDRKLSLGKGINVLFSGSPGTGKTMAAEVLATELSLDLFKIDLSQIVSKYIGETEKNLNRVFDEARASNAILFFDEADALFGKRSEVRDSHDRYANIEIAYLLQKMEEYEGLSVLATNLKKNLDEAFTRRLSFITDFPFPDEQSRLRIWQSTWPPELPLGEGLDLVYMAKQYRLSGGSIKNIAVAAAFLAAERGEKVQTAHLIRATRREFQKMGKPLTQHETGNYAPVAIAVAGGIR